MPKEWAINCINENKKHTMQDIKAIAAQEAEKYAKTEWSDTYNNLLPLSVIQKGESYTSKNYLDGFNKCLELLAGSEGAEDMFDTLSEYADVLGNELVLRKKDLKQLLAIHTAKMLGDRWIPVSETPPNELVRVKDINGVEANAYPTYYPFKVENTGGGKWASNIIPCDSYWDGGWLLHCEEISKPDISAITFWKRIPQSPNK